MHNASAGSTQQLLRRKCGDQDFNDFTVIAMVIVMLINSDDDGDGNMILVVMTGVLMIFVLYQCSLEA